MLTPSANLSASTETTVRHLPRVAGALLAVLSLLWLPAGCRKDEKPKPHSARAEAGIPAPGINVLIVTVDTTRADRLECYGFAGVKTPNINRLAEAGARFEQCISSAPLTLPSHASIMTGSYQFVHGARDNGSFKLASENETLAEVFKAAGYSTHAEVAAVVLERRYGLAQGFDTYGDLDHETRARQIAMHANAKGADARANPNAQEEPAPQGPSPWDLLDRKADDITREGIALLEQNKDHPFFIWLHYYDPHQGYTAPEPFKSQYADGYLAEIAFFDEQFGLVLDKLDELGLTDNTLVVLASDHGEGLGDHSELTHSYFVYDATQHVPLIMRAPGRIPAGVVVKPQVRLIDIAPTVLEFAGLESAPQVQGVGLVPLMLDPSASAELAAYSDTMTGLLKFNYSMLRAIRANGWKYILSSEPELYHVAEDDRELFNLIDAEPAMAAQMRQLLWDLIAESPAPPGNRVAMHSVDEESLKKLQALGYVGEVSATVDMEGITSGTELDHFEPSGVNPRKRTHVMAIANTVIGELLNRKFELAEDLVRRLLEFEPDNPTSFRQLCVALGGQQKFDEAEAACRRAIELQDQEVESYVALAWILQSTNRDAEAEKWYMSALEIDPTNYQVMQYLADLLLIQRRYREAIVHLEAAAEIAPDVSAVWVRWGRALRAVGKLDEAERKLRTALELDPSDSLARILLVNLLEDVGRQEDALAELHHTLEHDANSVPALEMLADRHAEQRQFDVARQYFDRAAAAATLPELKAIYEGLSLALADKPEDALARYRQSVEANPEFVRAWMELTKTLTRLNRLSEAKEAYDRLLDIKPRHPLVYTLSADLNERLGDTSRAIEILNKGLESMPANPRIANDLAWRLATSSNDSIRDGAKAVKLAETAIAAFRGSAGCNELDTLAAAYAEAGHFDKAVDTATRAVEMANQTQQPELAKRIGDRLALYQQNKPYRSQ